MSSEPNITYINQLLKSIFEEIKTIVETINSDKISFNGVWPFLYYEGSNSLKSLNPFFNKSELEKKLTQNEIDNLQKTVINCDYGSIGFALKNISSSNQGYDYLYRTFNEPRGVVCYLDSKIKQEHAVFIAIKDSANNILGILDVFFSGNIEECYFKDYSNNLFRNFNKNEQLKRLCTNTFTIQQFYEYQEQFLTISNDKKIITLQEPIAKIETILKLSGNTPIFYFTYNNYPASEEHVGLNFDIIYGFVAHEYRFCSYVRKDIECFFKKGKIANNLSCQNSLLKNFYYDIIKENNYKSIRKNLSVLNSNYNYILEIVYEKGKKEDTFSLQNNDISISEINKEIKEFKKFSNLNDVAENKFRDELYFSHIKEKYNDAIVLILYRKVKEPYLIYNGNNCDKHNEHQIKSIKDYISPSELLHYKYTSGEKEKPLLIRSKNTVAEPLKWNVIHFEILKPNFFIKTVKKKIASCPQMYCNILKPYLSNNHCNCDFNVSSFNDKGLKCLKLHYLGKDPQETGYFKSIINEQISLISNEYESKETIKHATRAAISQVMARNTSHNIGAHVMNKLIDNLNSIDIKNFTNYLPIPDILPSGEEEIFKQIAFFNNYVKCRMDYLSDISFGTPLMQTNKYAHNEIFKEFDKVRLLLENISGLSNFKYRIKFKKNGEELSANNDLLLAIPNDILGTQAFYNILENIIRNTAKHSDKTKLTDNEVVFTVNYIDDSPTNSSEDIKKILTDFIAVEVYDNVPVDSIDELITKQNNNLNDDILNQNKLRTNSLGLVEMEASAAYLRKRDVSLINDSKYDIIYDESWQSYEGHKYFLKAFKKAKEEEAYLAYRLFLPRPAVVLVITDNECKNKDELKKQGIWLVSSEEFSKHLSSGKVYNHEFVVFAKRDYELTKSIENYKTALPIRILEIVEQQLVTLLGSRETNKEKILDIWEGFCWNKWNEGVQDIDIVNSYDSKRSNVNQAVFLDHLSSNDTLCKIETTTKGWDENLNAEYLEALSSVAQNRMPDFYKITNDEEVINDNINEKFKFYIGKVKNIPKTKQKIIESVLCKVIVIDERIQESAYNRDFMGKKFEDLYNKINVIIPDKTINLSENSYTTDHIKKISEYIKKSINGTKPTDYLLIHYSIMERMFEKDEIETKLDQIIGDSKITTVITSGRGTPDNLSDNRRFVNLSSVITAFIDIRCKYVINNLLHSSRKTTKI